MAFPKVALRGRDVILLSGFNRESKCEDTVRRGVIVDARDKLVLAAKQDPDAVAFGYVAGEWVASA